MAGSHRRYRSDMTDEGWMVIEPILGGQRPDGRGRPRSCCLRQIVNAILYVNKTGCQWRYLPDFGPWPTVYWYFARWSADGTVDRIHDTLRGLLRKAEGRDPQPSAAIIDAQSVKAAETVAKDSRGYDAGKKINGRKRHIAVDTLGLLLIVVVTAGNVQDRDGGKTVLTKLAASFGTIGLVWADAGYRGKLVTWANTTLRIVVEIAKKIVDKTFTVQPRRWVVERTLAWITRHRRLARDYERLPTHAETWIKWAMIHTMTHQLTR